MSRRADFIPGDPAVGSVRAGGDGPDRLPLIRLKDLWSLPSRLSFAGHLARAAIADPRAFWISAVALRRHRAQQKPLELYRYLSFLRRQTIVRAMEIGSFWGGTFYAHAAVTDPRGQVISIDRSAREQADRMTDRFRHLAQPAQQVTCIWQDSHSSAAVRQVEDTLGGRPLDLLFLDGDHSLAGVRQDYETYGPLVRRGGIIAVHDITARVADGTGIPAFWRSLGNTQETLEIVDRVHAPHGLGIGVIVKT